MTIFLFEDDNIYVNGKPIWTFISEMVQSKHQLLKDEVVMITRIFENRVKIWDRLNKDFPKKFFEPITKVISLSDLPNIGKDILEGKIKGRVIVDVNI